MPPEPFHAAVDLPRSLTAREQEELTECETIIRRGWDTFIDVGRALARIRDGKLYRDRYQTFDAYCRERWQYGRFYAYRLIDASAVVGHLLTIGNTTGERMVPLPENEAQVRPLVGLKPDHAKKAWLQAVAAANGHGLTARLVEKAAAEFPKLDRDGLEQKKSARRGVVSPKTATFKTVFTLLNKTKEAVRNLDDRKQALKLIGRLEQCLRGLQGRMLRAEKRMDADSHRN